MGLSSSGKKYVVSLAPCHVSLGNMGQPCDLSGLCGGVHWLQGNVCHLDPQADEFSYKWSCPLMSVKTVSERGACEPVGMHMCLHAHVCFQSCDHGDPQGTRQHQERKVRPPSTSCTQETMLRECLPIPDVSSYVRIDSFDLLHQNIRMLVPPRAFIFISFFHFQPHSIHQETQN